MMVQAFKHFSKIANFSARGEIEKWTRARGCRAGSASACVEAAASRRRGVEPGRRRARRGDRPRHGDGSPRRPAGAAGRRRPGCSLSPSPCRARAPAAADLVSARPAPVAAPVAGLDATPWASRLGDRPRRSTPRGRGRPGQVLDATPRRKAGGRTAACPVGRAGRQPQKKLLHLQAVERQRTLAAFPQP